MYVCMYVCVYIYIYIHIHTYYICHNQQYTASINNKHNNNQSPTITTKQRPPKV